MSVKTDKKRVRFFIGDDVRSENGKPMIFGLCPSDKVLINIPAEQADPSNEAQIVLQGLAILTSFVGYYSGPYKAEASLYLPDGKALLEHYVLNTNSETAILPHMKDINLILKFAPFPVSQLGQYKFVIKLNNDEIEEYQFTIDRSIPYQSNK